MNTTLNPNGCPTCGSTAQYRNGKCGCGYDDARNCEGEPLNRYGEVATHDDCGDNHKGGCDGMMMYWENPHTGNTRLLCAEHGDQAEHRQAQIQRDYLNDTVHDEDY
jgi:hypothetical protein